MDKPDIVYSGGVAEIYFPGTSKIMNWFTTRWGLIVLGLRCFQAAIKWRM